MLRLQGRYVAVLARMLCATVLNEPCLVVWEANAGASSSLPLSPNQPQVRPADGHCSLLISATVHIVQLSTGMLTSVFLLCCSARHPCPLRRRLLQLCRLLLHCTTAAVGSRVQIDEAAFGLSLQN